MKKETIQVMFRQSLGRMNTHMIFQSRDQNEDQEEEVNTRQHSFDR